MNNRVERTERHRDPEFPDIPYEIYPEGLPGRKALTLLEEKVPPTPYEAGQYDSGRRYEKIVRWATVDAGKAGWMRKEKGLWYLTEDGIAAYSKFTDGEA